jgi:hypothetical protein
VINSGGESICFTKGPQDLALEGFLTYLYFLLGRTRPTLLGTLDYAKVGLTMCQLPIGTFSNGSQTTTLGQVVLPIIIEFLC